MTDEKRTLTRNEGWTGKGHSGNLISESGLYKLVMRSDKPAAREFQDWVTRTVLPAIRKDGMYVMGEENVAQSLVTAVSQRGPETHQNAQHIPGLLPVASRCTVSV